MANSQLVRTIDSPVGTLTLTVQDGALTGLHMHEQRHFPALAPTSEHDAAAAQPFVEQLCSYFAGELERFDMPLRMLGTPFQRRVWQGLQEIPYGETISYGELARWVGSPGASRAVGSANGRNPIAIVVPCHRVIAADGGIGGYGGGLERKTWLLEHEGAWAPVAAQQPLPA
ncbi:MAG TPA: methylated-DNA--[protein]-cysteine S-methyltransferase [Solirubrobacteraceae bacterium]|nr:methylated-DNA--[protein]-cysteine S-methyltransferase [Solirubrobacteraceae bacterium]